MRGGSVKCGKMVQLFVRIPVVRKTIVLDVEFSDNVSLIKGKIYQKTSIVISLQRLYLNGKELQDELLVSECNVQDEFTLHLLVCGTEHVRIFVNSFKGNVITLDEIDLNVTVETLKCYIEMLENIPTHTQCLLLKDEPLMDGVKLSSYKIQNDSVLQLMSSCKELSLQTPAGNIIPIEVDPIQTIAHTKIRIESKAELQAKHHLFLSGYPLEDNYIISYYNIPNKSVLSLVPENGMKIHIKSLTGDILPLRVNPFSTTQQIKAMIKQETNTELYQLCLLYNNKSLVDDLTLFEQKVYKDSTLHLANPCSKIFLKLSFSSRNIPIEVDSSDTINGIKTKSKQEGTIIFGNRKLNSSCTLCHYNIPDNSMLRLMYQPLRGLVEIFVKSFTGKMITLNIKPSDTVESLKHKIKDKEGIPLSQQLLVFNSKTLEDNHCPLSEYNIQQNVTIDLHIDGSATVQLFVAKNSQVTVALNVKQTASISDIKSKFQEKENVRHCYLVFAGKLLQDDRSLFDHNIQDGSTLYLVTPSKAEESYLLSTLQKWQLINSELASENERLKTQVDSLQSNYNSLQERFAECEQEKNQLHQNLEDSQISYQTTIMEFQTINQTLLESIEVNEIEKSSLLVENQILRERIKANEDTYSVDWKEIKLTKESLGRGGWGVVWIGEFRGSKVAVKQIHDELVSPGYIQLLNREINTMAQLRHPNLLQFIGAVFNNPSGNPMIITEIMDISLRGAYEKKQLSPVPLSISLSIMRDVAVGLNYLHCLPDPIIHRDVSSANVLLESKGPGKWKTKISDFGSARLARLAVTKAAGAEVYSAPESLQSIVEFDEKKLTTKMDTFSYGILLCEVLNSQFPDRHNFKEMLQKLHTQSISLHGLVESCIKVAPHERPVMKIIIDELNKLL